MINRAVQIFNDILRCKNNGRDAHGICPQCQNAIQLFLIAAQEIKEVAKREGVDAVIKPTTAAAAPCHRCKDYELILDVNFCPFCGFEFVRD